ncbi:MAG: hypothetical protein AAFS10_11530, partial [Myxococcota bacterium]
MNRSRWTQALLMLMEAAVLLLLGCGDTLVPGQAERPCEDVAEAIAYRSFLCLGDSDKANTRYDNFQATYTCESLFDSQIEPHYACIETITEASCDEADRFGDDLEAWLAYGATCQTGTRTEGDITCADFQGDLSTAVVERFNTCWGFTQALPILSSSMADDFDCASDLDADPEALAAARQACLEGLQTRSCSRQFSVEAGLNNTDCDTLISRVGSSQACGEMALTLMLAVSSSNIETNCRLPEGTMSSTLFDAFLATYTCTTDLTDPAQWQRHQQCLEILSALRCSDITSPTDVNSWVQRAGPD